MPAEEKVQRLMDEAYELLATFDIPAALRIADKLKKIGYSGAYEIMALAYQKDDQPELAIASLLEGVNKAPQVWLFWHLLGNLYSDAGDYAKAHDCYDKALACQNCDNSWVHYNRAVALTRQEQYQDALNECLKVVSSELELESMTLTVSLLNSLARFDEARTLANEVISRLQAQVQPEPEEIQQLGSAYAELARAFWEGKKDGGVALTHAWRSIEFDKANQLAMRIVREARNARSKDAGWYKVIVEGKWHEPFEGEKKRPAFFTSYEVVADSTLECLDLIKEFEPAAVRDSLKIENLERIEESPQSLKGVYWRGGYAFFTGQGKAKSRSRS